MARNPAFERVFYVTPTATAPLFIPGNCQAPTNSHDNPNNGTDVQREASCQQLVDVDGSAAALGVAVTPGTLVPR